MGWDGNGGVQPQVQGLFGEGQASWAVSQAWLSRCLAVQGLPRGAAAADDDGRRLCGVRTELCSEPL